MIIKNCQDDLAGDLHDGQKYKDGHLDEQVAQDDCQGNLKGQYGHQDYKMVIRLIKMVIRIVRLVKIVNIVISLVNIIIRIVIKIITMVIMKV